MLYRNVLSLICILGMALAIPVDKRALTVSLVELETAPTPEETGTQVIVIEHYVTDAPFADNEDAEPVVDEIPPFADEANDKIEENQVAEEDVTEGVDDAEDANVEDANVEDADAEPADDAENADAEPADDAENADAEPADDAEAVTIAQATDAIVDEEETPYIPENEEPDVDPTVCSKDLLLMGNKIDHTHACDEIYEACTNKELISVIMYYYSKSSPVSIEYTINENINKSAISEKCGKILINSKIFQEETTIIEGDIRNPDPVKKIVSLNQDIALEAPAAEKVKNEIKENSGPRRGDAFAELSEDEIEE